MRLFLSVYSIVVYFYDGEDKLSLYQLWVIPTQSRQLCVELE